MNRRILRLAAVAAAAVATTTGLVSAQSAVGISAGTAQAVAGTHNSASATGAAAFGKRAPNPATIPTAQRMTAAQQEAQRTALKTEPGQVTNKRATYTFNNWSGLAAPGSYQGIAGQWVVPAVAATTANHYSSTWVGIDGLNNNSLIQTGTEEDSIGGRTSYTAWYEMLPANETLIRYTNGTLVPVAPGDTMWSYIMRTGTGNAWVIYLQNQTRGWTFNYTVNYVTPGASVEWIHEATKVGGVIGTPPAFSTVNFTNLEVEQNNTWYYTGMNANNRVFLVQNGVRYATPSAPTATSPQRFSVVYGS